MTRRARRIRDELPHGVDSVAIVWGDFERERDVCTATGEFHNRRPIGRLFVQRTDAKDVGEIPSRKNGPELQGECLHWLAV